MACCANAVPPATATWTAVGQREQLIPALFCGSFTGGRATTRLEAPSYAPGLYIRAEETTPSPQSVARSAEGYYPLDGRANQPRMVGSLGRLA